MKIINPVKITDLLNEVDYSFPDYMPSDEAFDFVNFIKLVNDGGDENETPIVHLKMMDNVFNVDKRNAIMCHRGIGKKQKITEPILTPSGWTTMGDIRVDDIVMTRTGEAATVSYKTPEQFQNDYKMTLSDGAVVLVGEDHNHIVTRRSRGKYVDKVVTTVEMIERGLTVNKSKKRKGSKDGKAEYRFKIPLASPMMFEHKTLDEAPYAMGYWLANGHTSSHTAIACYADDALEIMTEFGRCGYTVGTNKVKDNNSFAFSILNIPFKRYRHLRSRTKYIPEEYKFGSIEQRTELLRGLMDGDGHISKNGSSTYDSYSKQLAEDVLELSRSLGAYATLKQYGDTYRVRIQIKINPFKLERKASVWRPSRVMTKQVVSLEEIFDDVPSHCITVDHHTESYITSGYTVTHNTALFGEYLILYMAAFGVLPGFGSVNLVLYVTDSIENGVKNLRRNVEHRYRNSDFLRKMIPDWSMMTSENEGVDFEARYDSDGKYIPKAGAKFTDIRLEFVNTKGHKLVIKGYGSKSLSLDSILYTDNGLITISECKIGDRIYGPNGKLASIVEKSEVFNRPMYELKLLDGRHIKVSEDHINSVLVNIAPNGIATWKPMDLTTEELLRLPLKHYKTKSSKHLVAIENCAPIEYSEKQLPLDPYVLGLLLGDGSMKKDGSNVLHAHIDDMEFYLKHIDYELGSYYIDKRNGTVVSQAIKKISNEIRELEVNVHGDYKFVPEIYKTGSIQQRLDMLSGLMDTDGTISKSGRMSFTSNSKQLVDDVANLVRSLSGEARVRKQTEKSWHVEIKIDINIFKLPRKKKRFKLRVRTTNRVPVVSITRISDEPSQCIAIDNEDHQFLTDNYFRTHNTGVRGAKELGVRPQLAILDDLVSDEDARSDTIIGTIENTVNKAVSKALHPARQKTIWLGTPFNQKDPLYKAVESGAWKTSVFPIAQEFDVSTTKETFIGSWDDRFSFEYVKDEFDKAMAMGRPEDFDQELMLRIMSKEQQLVQESDIIWFNLETVLKNKGNFNYLITTDLTTSGKNSADFAGIFVWAISANKDRLLVDVTLKKQGLKESLDDLFFYARKWSSVHGSIDVGIELDGQQEGFLVGIEERMLHDNNFFNIANQKGTTTRGIRSKSMGSKHQRFIMAVPQFKLHKIWFPREFKGTAEMIEILNEITNVSSMGFQSRHDDAADCISQLEMMTITEPSGIMDESERNITKANDSYYWGDDWDDPDEGAGNSYV